MTRFSAQPEKPMRSLRPRGLAALLGALACGCALTAQKVPTPAAQLTANELAQLAPTPQYRYFVLFFGSQDFFRHPKYTHTWAALVRVPAGGCNPAGLVTKGCIDPALDVQTISWLPVDGTIEPRNYVVEPGRNYGFHETLKFAYDGNESVAMWGPYEVWHGFAHRFMVQKQFLDSGAVGYQCVDVRGEAAKLGNGCDCIHAITDMDPIYPRWGYPLLYYGKPGTGHLVRRFMHSPIWINPRQTHDWLLPRLGLEGLPIERRTYIGRTEEHDPNSPVGLDARARSLPIPTPPRPKEPTPKSAPGIENKIPTPPTGSPKSGTGEKTPGKLP
jgi:hypothetical protein